VIEGPIITFFDMEQVGCVNSVVAIPPVEKVNKNFVGRKTSQDTNPFPYFLFGLFHLFSHYRTKTEVVNPALCQLTIFFSLCWVCYLEYATDSRKIQWKLRVRIGKAKFSCKVRGKPDSSTRVDNERSNL